MDNLATIFISMASYRDPELIPTLRDMLRHAVHPENLHIAVCWQDDEDLRVFEQAGLEPVDCRIVAGREVHRFNYRQARIDIISVHYYASQGACWARSLSETLFEEERYFLQIDSHCRFISCWDSEMIAMLHSLQSRSPLPILSSYPPPYCPGEDEEASKKTYVSRLIFREFNQQGIPMFSSAPFESPEPVRGSYLAGGFIFTTSRFVKDIPNDPHIFFAGEEIAMTVRAFSHGYDIFHPHKPLLWHFYQRKEHRKVWSDHDNSAKEQGAVEKAWWERDNVSKKRVRTLLGLEAQSAAALAPYTLGNERTLRQFEYQAGIHLKNGTVLPEVMAPSLQAFFADPPADEADWIGRQYAWYKKSITLKQAEYFPSEAETSSLNLSVYNQQNTLLYKRMFTLQELETFISRSQDGGWVIPLEFKTASTVKPEVVRICPWSTTTGWGTVTEKRW
ncbi:UDP-N-acetylglucosamine-transferase [Enterobacteriaceae bacterium H18W14]|uniref:GlcNAc-transferase family protein n=1 Tax=Dryocola boscaweniae TaxID=2925397 RepID=UPI0022F035AF|nr:GlcNAc-transferase family protein [Dryocola boscaweniae]MCT4715759.1 UDP-N-acetylglucosamine-transferase [Dryocola boscaweniae]